MTLYVFDTCSHVNDVHNSMTRSSCKCMQNNFWILLSKRIVNISLHDLLSEDKFANKTKGGNSKSQGINIFKENQITKNRLHYNLGSLLIYSSIYAWI